MGPSASLDVLTTEIPLPFSPLNLIVTDIRSDRNDDGSGRQPPLATDSASLELQDCQVGLSEGIRIPARCVRAHSTPCVVGIGHGHVRPRQFHDAVGCFVGLAVGPVGLAMAYGTCQNGVANLTGPTASCLSRYPPVVRANAAMRKSR